MSMMDFRDREKTTSNERSKTVAVLSGKKGVQQQSDTPTLSSSSTNAIRTTTNTNTTTGKEPHAVQQQMDNATQDVQMKGGENKSQGEKTTSTENSKTVLSSSSTTDKLNYFITHISFLLLFHCLKIIPILIHTRFKPFDKNNSNNNRRGGGAWSSTGTLNSMDERMAETNYEYKAAIMERTSRTSGTNNQEEEELQRQEMNIPPPPPPIQTTCKLPESMKSINYSRATMRRFLAKGAWKVDRQSKPKQKRK